MKRVGGSGLLIALASSFVSAQVSWPVSIGVAAASKALNEMRLTADEPAPAPVPSVPDAQPVPDSSSPDVTHLVYDSEPGLSLYRTIKAMDDLATRNCSGGACLGLWGIQESYAATFVSLYKSTVPLLYSADRLLGDAAHDLAGHTCGRKFTTGDDNATSTLYRMLYQQNEVMAYLKVLQSNAGRKGKDIASCVPSDLPVE